MKILLTTDWWVPAVNGVVRSVLLLRQQLIAQGHDVKVLTLSSTGHSYEEDGIIYLGSLNAGRIYPGARIRCSTTGHWREELRNWRPDIVHSQCEFSTFGPAWRISRRCGCPLVHTYHTVYEDYTRYLIPSVHYGRLAVQQFTRLIAARCTALVAPTNKVRDLLLDYNVKCPIYTVPTGIDLTAFSPVKREERPALRRQLGLPEEKILLVAVGRVAAEKNPELLVQFLAQERPEDRPTLVFVGDGPYRAELEQLTAELGLSDWVIFTGMITPEKVMQYYQAGDAFACASRSETQGLTYFEALACGLPLFCREDTCLDGVVENGWNGWLWNDYDEFHAALSALRAGDEERWTELSRNALDTAERYSAENFARQVLNVYNGLLEREDLTATV